MDLEQMMISSIQLIHVFWTLDIQKADDLNASIGLEDESNLFLWNIVFEGPEDSLYEGGYFKAQL